MSITEETRRESHDIVKENAAARRQVILSLLRQSYCGMTAWELATKLYERGYTQSIERNFVAPRLTELKAEGRVEVVDKKRCSHSGRNVAVWKVKEV